MRPRRDPRRRDSQAAMVCDPTRAWFTSLGSVLVKMSHAHSPSTERPRAGSATVKRASIVADPLAGLRAHGAAPRIVHVRTRQRAARKHVAQNAMMKRTISAIMESVAVHNRKRLLLCVIPGTAVTATATVLHRVNVSFASFRF